MGQCWAWMYLGISKPDPSTSGYFWSKPCTEQSQHGLPLCPFVISLLADEPLSSPPVQILTPVALLQPDQLSLVQGVPGQLWLSHNRVEPGAFLLLEIVWGRSAPGAPAFCLHSYFAKERALWQGLQRWDFGCTRPVPYYIAFRCLAQGKEVCNLLRCL